jgi:putative salt-induced outer membrane protein
MRSRFIATVAVFLLLTANVRAQEAVASAAEVPWSGKVALGYLATSGNSESSSLNTKFDLAYASGKWQNFLEAAAISAQESNQSTAEAYRLGFKSEFTFSEHNYLFGRVVWRKDLFSGYDRQFSQTVGYGRRLIETKAHLLSVEIGAGARQSILRDGTSEDDVILRGGANYSWIISPGATFSQILAVESGEVNTYLESVSALKAHLIGELALVASFTIKNNSDVPAGTEQTDTYSALSLEYAF